VDSDKCKDKFAALQDEEALRSTTVKKMRTGPSRKKKAEKGDSMATEKKVGKKMTKWDNSKLSKREIQELDRSKELTEAEEERQLREKREAYIGVCSCYVVYRDDTFIIFWWFIRRAMTVVVNTKMQILRTTRMQLLRQKWNLTPAEPVGGIFQALD
jgi:hypothetical protein